MANIRLIKRRIRSARNISQITRAMEMVAASKMKKAQEKALGAKPYAQKIFQVVGELVKTLGTNSEKFPLLRQEKIGEKSLVILISTNKGLCGGLNTNLFRFINHWFPKELKIDFITLGKKGENFILGTKRNLLADFSNFSFLENVGALVNLFTNGFINKEYQEVDLVYNDFSSILKQEPRKKTILPIGLSQIETENKEIQLLLRDFLLEPNITTLLNALLPHYLEVQVREAILEAEASEYAARMMAMKAATDNALELVKELTLLYNKYRQQIITYEIADIITAKEAIQ